jgi:hypothetical protein
VLNRRGTLGPEPGKRSRGELALEALDHAGARDAADALSALEPAAYRPFNLIVADAVDAFWLRHAGSEPIRVQPVAEGFHMIEAGEFDDPASMRIARFLPQFRFVPVPDPERGDWSAWEALLADRTSRGGDPRDAMTIVTDGDYGTVSSSLVALPRHVTDTPVFLHAEGRPGDADYRPAPG